MRTTLPSRRIALVVLLVTAACATSAPHAPNPSTSLSLRVAHRVATWGASPQAADPDAPAFEVNGETVREIVRSSLGGTSVRVRLSNAYGNVRVRVGAVHVALCGGGSSIVPGSDRVLTFGGRPEATLAPGAELASDPVALALPPLADVAVTLYFPERTPLTTEHSLALQTTYVSPPGDLTGAAVMPGGRATHSWYLLDGLDVEAPRDASAIVALGDSITDGYASTLGASHRWTDLLATRLRAEDPHEERGVVNEGIAGNRILETLVGESALARFDRDVLGQPGAKYLVLLEGINDIGNAALGEVVTAARIVAADREIARRAHAAGLKVIGATLLPFEGLAGLYSEAGEGTRQQVNAWIRTTKELDAKIDFDLALRDPAHPARLTPSFDSGDHGHPSDAGYEAMARAVDLSIFHERHD